MAYGIGGGGIIGIAFEATAGTYVAPVKYVPILSEGLKFMQDTQWRRPIRQSVDVIGAVAGDSHVEGDLDFEAVEDVIAYFLYASRTTIIKTGAGPYVYTTTPNASAVATAARTLSITIVRDGIVFGYTGCVVGNFKFTPENGILKMSVSIVGMDELVQSLPTATWPTTVPFGAGQYSIEIPTATPVLDTDTFEFSVEDNAEPQYRLRSTGRSATFIKFGERATTFTLERDFQTRTDYDAFKALTAQTITVSATKDATHNVSILIPVAIKETYEVTLQSQGDLVRAQIAYQGVYDGTKAYQIIVKTDESII